MLFSSPLSRRNLTRVQNNAGPLGRIVWSESFPPSACGHPLIACQTIIIFTMCFDEHCSWLGGWPLPCTLCRHTGFGSNKLWQKLDCQKYPLPPPRPSDAAALWRCSARSGSLWDSVCLSWSSAIISFAEWLRVISRLLRRMRERILWHNRPYRFHCSKESMVYPVRWLIHNHLKLQLFDTAAAPQSQVPGFRNQFWWPNFPNN